MLFKKYEPKDIDTSRLLTNESYLTQKFLFNGQHDYDSFLIGPSTAQNIFLNDESGGKWYNFSMVYFSLWETERFIKELLKKGIKIKNLVIVISQENAKCTETYNYYENCKLRFGLEYFPMPTNIKEKLYFYSKYFFSFATFNYGINKIKELFNKEQDGINTQENDFVFSDEEVINRLPVIKDPFNIEKIDNIKAIVNLAKENDINIIFYFVPVYQQVYKLGNIDDYNNFKRELVKVTPFYDFSGLNSVTKDTKYWDDLIHGNNLMSALIQDRLFSNNENNKNNDFGIYVTGENIEKHIKMLEQQVTKE